MRAIRKWGFSLNLLLLALLLPTGCRRTGYRDEKERNKRMVAQAYTMMAEGNDTAAVDLFHKALTAYPSMARPHLDLALILHDRRKDYVRAIYHYQRYIELRQGTEKETMILERIRQAENAFVADRTIVAGAEGQTVTALMEENRLLRDRLETMRRTLIAHEAESVGLREAERKRLQEEVLSNGAPPLNTAAEFSQPPPVQTPVPVPASVPVPVPERDALVSPPQPAPMDTGAVQDRVLEKSPRTYVVQPGDSLSQIAHKIYGDATQWRIIHQANRQALGDAVNVRVGQVLVVP